MTYEPYVKPALAVGYGAYSAYAARRSTKPVYRSSQSYTRYSKPRNRRGLRYGFKAKMLSNTPAKHVMTNDNQTNIVGGVHNTIYTCNLTAGIVAGTGDNQRVGDAVQLLSLKINALISSNAAVTASCQWRVLIGWSGEELNVPAQLSAAGLTASQIFHAGTGGAWQNTAIVNPKAFTVLDDRVYTLNNSITAVSDIQEIAYTIPCNTSFPYQSAGSVFGKNRNLYLVVIPCILGATGNTGSIALSSDLIFKQL